ncbi:MAG TPA: hypothetical protein VH025_02730, partial [Solirubrobacteraceae bacterium]|nr:hypothetical protein [Solirubrobacteraceae bacterium]
GPTLKKLKPFAQNLGPANEATRKLALKTAPIIKNEIRPFAREILPTVAELPESTKQIGEAFPKLAVSFSVLNEFFNELAADQGTGKESFLFFLDWANHNLNSVVSSADANGTIGRSIIYFNCEILTILEGAEEVNPTIRLLSRLLKPPTKAECEARGIKLASAASASVNSAALRKAATLGAGPFSGLESEPFGSSATAGKRTASAHTASAGGGR